MTRFNDQMKAFFRDRRVRMGAAATLSIVALLSVGVMAVVVAAKPETASADVSDLARLSVVADPAPRPQAMPVSRDKLATLDAEQIASINRPPEPLDPTLQAALVEEHREQASAAAEQRAFDARLRADMAEAPVESSERSARPAEGRGSTSNSEDDPG